LLEREWAQGNGNGQNPLNVNIVNAPLPVTGNLNAVVSGNVSAHIINLREVR
jgi:hypothetical protein